MTESRIRPNGIRPDTALGHPATLRLTHEMAGATAARPERRPKTRSASPFGMADPGLAQALRNRVRTVSASIRQLSSQLVFGSMTVKASVAP